METVEETIDVDVPVHTAYDQWTQFETFPEFMSGVDSVRQLTDTTNHWKTHIGGVEREFDTEIVEQRPDERIAWRSVDGKSHAGVVTFTPLDMNHTKVAVHFEWAPETFAEKAGAALNIDNMQVKSDMRKFKHFIESRGTETGAWRGTVTDTGATGSTLGGTTGTTGPMGGTTGSTGTTRPMDDTTGTTGPMGEPREPM